MQIYVQSCSRSITCEESARLMDAAFALAASRERRLDIREEGFQGRVTTAWTYSTIAEISGVLFEASFDSERGSREVTFIVRTADIGEVAACGCQGHGIRPSPFFDHDVGNPFDVGDRGTEWN